MRRTRIDGEWLDLVSDLLDAPLTELPAARIAAALNSTFDLTGTSFNDREPGPRVLRIWARDARMLGRLDDIVEWRVEHPLAVYYARTLDDVPRQIADLPSRLVHATVRGAWAEYARPRDSEAVLLLPLRAHHRAFALARSAPFSPSEIAQTRRVWRLVRGLDRQVRALAAVRPDPVVVEDLTLTPRQVAVLGLVARGFTAAAVARRLGISERTVHKHLEQIYARLGVSDRLSAVLRAHRAGLFPP